MKFFYILFLLIFFKFNLTAESKINSIEFSKENQNKIV